jgi:hypothetical protein
MNTGETFSDNIAARLSLVILDDTLTPDNLLENFKLHQIIRLFQNANVSNAETKALLASKLAKIKEIDDLKNPMSPPERLTRSTACEPCDDKLPEKEILIKFKPLFHDYNSMVSSDADLTWKDPDIIKLFANYSLDQIKTVYCNSDTVKNKKAFWDKN